MKNAQSNSQSKLTWRQIVVVLGLTCAVTSSSANADGLEWTIAPYLWASDVGLDLRINDDPVLGGDVSFDDLLDKVDTALMGHAEVRGERWGAFVDLIYIDLSDGQVIPVGPGNPIGGDVIVDNSLKLQIYELGGLYRFTKQGAAASNFDFIFGARQIEMDLDINVTLPGPGGGQPSLGTDNSETDIFAGFRFIGKFNDRWGYKARADYGAGGTEGALNFLATIGYTFGQSGLFTLDVGYRYFTVELEKSLADNATANTDITMSGPVVGFIFKF